MQPIRFKNETKTTNQLLVGKTQMANEQNKEILQLTARHVVKPGLDWTCKTWTGLICKTWTGLRTIQFAKPGLDSFVKPGLDSFVKHGLDSFVKHGLDSFVKHGLIFSSIDEHIDIFFYSI